MRFLERNGSAIIFVATSFWWAVFLAMHILQPGLDPLRAPGSAYVLGEYGVWARATYFALAATLLAPVSVCHRVCGRRPQRVQVGSRSASVLRVQLTGELRMAPRPAMAGALRA